MNNPEGTEYSYSRFPIKPGEEEAYWKNLFFLEDLTTFEKTSSSYDFLRDISSVYNLYPASTPQPQPMSHRVLFIIDTLTKLGVKYTIDIFEYDGSKVIWGHNSHSSHKLVNIIAEPNPEATGPAIVFCAHHDVANVHSQNCQDNSASVCHLLSLANLISKDKLNSKKTLILFSDSEESGARGAKHFASKSKKNKENPSIIEHDIYGEIDAVINLELTGKGTIVWSDCEAKSPEITLHEKLEHILGTTIPKLKTPPSDSIAFRRYGYPVLCIGILPEEDIKIQNTWRICHSMKDTIEGCDRTNMEDFTTFLFNLTKITTEHGRINIIEETGGTLPT